MILDVSIYLWGKLELFFGLVLLGRGVLIGPGYFIIVGNPRPMNRDDVP
jgi:hypothetical protein